MEKIDIEYIISFNDFIPQDIIRLEVLYNNKKPLQEVITKEIKEVITEDYGEEGLKDIKKISTCFISDISKLSKQTQENINSFATTTGGKLWF